MKNTADASYLLNIEDTDNPQRFPLLNKEHTIGRAPTCDIVINHRVISRLHAYIRQDGPRYFLHDAGSSNGTFVNHHLIQAPYHLKHKDLIGLGEPTPTLRFMDPDPTFVPQSRLTYDKRSMAFYLNQTEIKLTPIQFRLMQHLYQNTGRVCTRESCAEAIWGREYDPGLDADALDRNISNLRRQLRQIDEETDLIETKRGIGYVLHLI